MKLTTAVLGVLMIGGAGVALAVPTKSTTALDRVLDAAKQGNTPKGARKPIPMPTSALEVGMALKTLDTETQALEEELTSVDKELTEVEARVLARGRTYFKQVRAGLLPAGGGFDELVDHAARVERTRLSLGRDLERSKELRARRDEITDVLSRIAAERIPLEAQKKAYDSAKTVMRQADERRAAFDRAFDSSTAPSEHVAVYGVDQGPSDDVASSGFKSMYGKLPFPLAGRAEVRKLEQAGATGPALELKTPGSATARSVAAGRVVFADQYEDDRMTVILDHGDRYFTLYGNLAASEVRVGDNVGAGEALGPVATRRKDAVLYFELRKDGRAVEPAPWFGL